MSFHVIGEPIRSILLAALVGLSLAFAGWTGSVWFLTAGLIIAIGVGVAVPAALLGSVVLVLPWFFRPVAVSSQAFAASELLVVAATVSSVIRAFVLCAYRRRSGLRQVAGRLRRVTSSRVVWLAAIVTGVAGVLVLIPYDTLHRAESLREWRWTFLEPLLFVALLEYHQRERDLKTILLGLLLLGGGVAAAQAFADLATSGGVSAGGVSRISGPYPHPNALALFLSRVVAVGIAWVVVQPSAWRWIGPLTALAGAGLVATFSRGALLAVLAVILVLMVRMVPRMRLIIGGLAAVSALLLVIIARDRVLDLFGGGSGSLRLDIWSSALRMIRDRPILGYGPDQFLYAYAPRYIEPTAWSERFTAHAHNLLFDFWVRIGIIGAAFVLALVTFWILRIAQFFRESEPRHPYESIGIIGLGAVLAHGLVDNAYFSHDLALSFWLFVWLAFDRERAGASEGAERSARPNHGRRGVHRLAPLRQPAR